MTAFQPKNSPSSISLELHAEEMQKLEALAADRSLALQEILNHAIRNGLPIVEKRLADFGTLSEQE